MTKGKALKLSDVERIHADLIKLEDQRLAVAKKHRITLETLNKIDWVRRRAGKYGKEATLRVRGHKVSQQSDQAECGSE